MTCKFKVGDKVRANEKSNHQYECTCARRHWEGEVIEVDRDDGTWDIKVRTLKEDSPSLSNVYLVSSQFFDLITPTTEEIHVTVKGNETIAVYKHDCKTEKAVAKCSPHDTFDFKVGAKLALERVGVLVPEVEEKLDAPKYFTGRVVCTFSKHDFWTVGKIYKVDNGTIFDDEDDPRFYRTEEELINGSGLFSGTVKFLPIVE